MVSALDDKQILELSCVAQNYDWGIIGKNSLVADIWNANTGLPIDQSKPYAELWMGTHPNGPSSVQLPSGGTKPLREVLGKDLPFLFKILSVQKALSIQAHPDKELAIKLHAQFPSIYKDPNHKPEIAIALTQFEALCGFRPLQQIAEMCEKYPEFASLLSQPTVDQLANSTDPKATLKTLFRELMECDPDLVKTKTEHLLSRLSNPHSLESLFVRLTEEFPGEVGCFCIFVMNYVTLQPGECVFLAANEPHAYLKGECVECMALSDNVVRAGLTPKFRDVETLCNMLTYNTYNGSDVFTRPTTISKHSTLYEAPVEEFSVIRTRFTEPGQTETIDRKSETILLCLEGTLSISIEKGQPKTFSKGSILVLPCEVKIDIKCLSEHCLVYQAFQP